MKVGVVRCCMKYALFFMDSHVQHTYIILHTCLYMYTYTYTHTPQPLRNSLRLMGAPPSLVPDIFEFQLSFSITNYLHKLKKQAKIESERMVSAISQNRTNDAHKRSNGM